MKYLLTQIFMFFGGVIFLYYLSTLSYFVPYDKGGDVNWYNVVVVLVLLFISIESLVALIIFTVQKFVAFGRKEFPDRAFSLYIGLTASAIVVIILLMTVLS